MTKHEYHIALVLLALITAGVLGYQALNPETRGSKSDCTLALYFSGPNGCNNSPAVESISAPVFTEKIEDYFSPRENNNLHTYNKNSLDSAYDIRPGKHKKEHPIPVNSGLNSGFDDNVKAPLPDLNDPLFLLSESHNEFLDSVFGSSP